jgi:hypothetical protein
MLKYLPSGINSPYFYEKVVKVKADVVVILHFFLPLEPSDRG